MVKEFTFTEVGSFTLTERELVKISFTDSKTFLMKTLNPGSYRVNERGHIIEEEGDNKTFTWIQHRALMKNN